MPLPIFVTGQEQGEGWRAWERILVVLMMVMYGDDDYNDND